MPKPQRIAGLPPARALAGGYAHACILDHADTPWCWGGDYCGQLGNAGENDRSSAPAAIDRWSGARALLASSDTTCALLDGGSLECFGCDPRRGGGRAQGSTDPWTLLDERPIRAVAHSALRGCGLLRGGEVLCWGVNSEDLPADGAPVDVATVVPIRVALDEPARAIDSDFFGSCAIGESGTLRCWSEPNDTPAVIRFDARVIAIDLGPYHGCAVLEQGEAYCWGRGAMGQLGDGKTHDRAAPTRVVGLPEPVTQTGVGESHSCAATAGGVVYCWGDNAFGQLGNGSIGGRDPIPGVVTFEAE